jgi:hypothetical protein
MDFPGLSLPDAFGAFTAAAYGKPLQWGREPATAEGP